MPTVHALLARGVDTRTDDAALGAEIAACRRALGSAVAAIDAHRGLATADVYARFELATPGDDADPHIAALRGAVSSCPLGDRGAVSVDRLTLLLDVPGAAHNAAAPIHYVVETDPAEGWDDELDRWYDTEHMPALAGIPGCVRARRFRNLDGGPRSCACYDLVAPGVLLSDAWLAVRRTPWSERVRPQFRNTRRTMFRTLPP